MVRDNVTVGYDVDDSKRRRHRASFVNDFILECNMEEMHQKQNLEMDISVLRVNIVLSTRNPCEYYDDDDDDDDEVHQVRK